LTATNTSTPRASRPRRWTAEHRCLQGCLHAACLVQDSPGSNQRHQRPVRPCSAGGCRWSAGHRLESARPCSAGGWSAGRRLESARPCSAGGGTWSRVRRCQLAGCSTAVLRCLVAAWKLARPCSAGGGPWRGRHCQLAGMSPTPPAVVNPHARLSPSVRSKEEAQIRSR
jgi:hypothetical protein